MLWYTLERYVHCLLGESFIKIPNDDDHENTVQNHSTESKKLVPDVSTKEKYAIRQLDA